MSALFPSTAHFSSSALRAVHHGREQTEKREARPKEHVPRLLCPIRACTPQAITPAEASYLLAGASHPVPTFVDAHCWEMRQLQSEDEHRRSIQIRTMPITKKCCLNLSNALLIPCASLSTVSRTINFLFKVLFIFPSRYLFAIGLVPIFSFRRSLPPILGCITKQPDSQKTHRERCTVPRTGLSPSTMCRSKQLKYCAFALKTNL